LNSEVFEFLENFKPFLSYWKNKFFTKIVLTSQNCETFILKESSSMFSKKTLGPFQNWCNYICGTLVNMYYFLNSENVMCRENVYVISKLPGTAQKGI